MRSMSQAMKPCTKPATSAGTDGLLLSLVPPSLPLCTGTQRSFRERAAVLLSSLTPRQSLVLDHILAGSPSKTIAFDLHISQRTVENHRAAIAKKMEARSLSALIHSAICGRCFLAGECGGIDADRIGMTCPEAPPVALLQAAPYSLPVLKANDDPALLRLAMAEIQHRLKNIAAVVQSLTNQTMHHSATKQEFAERITSRLGAYCRSLDLLTSASWSEVDVRTLVEAQLQPFGIEGRDQIEIQGDPVWITPAVARGLGLALHELATNALKYGALSVPSGQVRVTWTTLGIGGFRLMWREQGGPTVSAPKRQGFGGRMLEELTARSASNVSRYVFEPSGVTWIFECPASAMLAA